MGHVYFAVSKQRLARRDRGVLRGHEAMGIGDGSVQTALRVEHPGIRTGGRSESVPFEYLLKNSRV